MSDNQLLSRLLTGVFGLSLLYALFSYSLTDPNLILTSWPPYWQFQQLMWQTFFHNRQLMSSVYTGLVLGFFGLYLLGLRLLEQRSASGKKASMPAGFFIRYLLAVSPLFLSYNALSHDVFNYIFNAKMAAVFHANPHVRVALDFAYDPWTRFMHNTHTPAPYGYGWTALSLIPYALGFGKFLPTWLIFRGFAVLSIWLLFISLRKISRNIRQQPFSLSQFWLVFLNPLLIIEVISNQHNDLWMMVPALAGAALLFLPKNRLAWSHLIQSVLLLAGSVSVKLATFALAPIWLLHSASRWLPKLRHYFSWERAAFWSSVLLFLPLLTLRSQQFLPWYLLWAFVWLPFIRQPQWRSWLIGLSVTALLRYVPWLWAGEFTEAVLLEQKWVLWGGGVLLWSISQFWSQYYRLRYNKAQ